MLNIFKTRLLSFIILSAFLSLVFPQKSFSANIDAILDSADGSSIFNVQDSGTVEVFHVDSDGNGVFKGCLRIDSGGAECTDVEGLVVDGNITISGNKLFMATNTSGAILVADGTNFNPVVMSGDATVSTTGVLSLTTNSVNGTELSSTSVTPGFYTAAFIAVDADGRIIDAASGSLTGLTDIGAATKTAGNLLVADGTKFQSVTMSGSCTLASTGAIYCADNGATSLTGLSDLGSTTATSGNLLIADGTKFQSVAVTGDVTITSAGVTAIGNDKVGPAQLIATAVTPGSYSSAAISVDADGRVTSAASGSLTGLSDVGTAAITAGRVLVADGTKYQSVAISNDATLASDGALTLTANSVNGTELSSTGVAPGVYSSAVLTIDTDGRITSAAGGAAGATALTGLSDVGSSATTTGNILVADGTQFQSVGVSGDAGLASSGALTLTANSVNGTELSSTPVTAGNYSSAFITVDADGRIVNAANGSLTGLTDVGSATITTGRLLVADGTKFQSVTMSGSCTLASDGNINCNDTAGATSLTGLSDIGNAAVTAANLLVADGTKFQSVGITGDVTLTSAGVTAIGNNKVGAAQIISSGVTAGFYTSSSITVDADGRIIDAATGSLTGLSDVGSATITAGRLLVADGTKFQSVSISGSCTLASNGAINCNDNSGATSLTGLSDVGSATITAGRLLVADGTQFQSVAVSNDATLASSGALTLTANSVNGTELSSTAVTPGAYTAANITVDADGRITDAASGSLTGLTDVGSATITAGRLLVADGTQFQSVSMSGSCSLAANGAITCNDSGATSLTGLSDVGSATITAGQLLVADGTKFQSVAVSNDATLASSGALTLSANSVNGTELSSTAVTAGTYSSAEITVDADGRIINAASGSLTGLTDVGSATITAGRLLVADGTKFQSVAITGSCSLAANGAISCADSGATSLTGLSDVGSATITAGRLLVADGTQFQSVAVSGDATLASSGALTLTANSVNGTELSSTAVTPGSYTASNITVDADGRIIDAASGSLTGLTDVGSALTTAGNILAADGTKFQSVGTAVNSTTNTINIQADVLSTGKIASFVSNAAGTETRTLVQITNDNSAAVGAIGLTIQQDSLSPAISLTGSGGHFFLGPANATAVSHSAGGLFAPSFDSADDCNDLGGICTGVYSAPIADNPITPELSAITGHAQTAGTGFTLNNAYAIYAQNASKGGGDTITNQYGVYIDDQSQGVKNFGLYSAGATNLNYFANNVGIGTTGPSQKLHIVGDARITDLASCNSIQSDANGVLSCGSSATSLTGLTDIGSATITAANLLIADGTKFQSVGLTGDATVSSAGLLTLATNSVNGTELSSTAVTAGTYSSAAITVDTDGRIINAASGSLTGLTDVGSAIITAGKLLVADGTKFQSVSMSGSCTLASNGAINCNDTSGATSLTGLSDVGSATITAGRLLVADGTQFQSVAVSGDANLASSGALTLTANSVNGTELSSTSVTPGTYSSAEITVDADGRIVNAASGSLTGLTDVGSATNTAGRLLIADGTKFQSVSMSGSCTLASNGAITCTDTSGATSLTGLSDVGSATITAGRLLVADGTQFQSVAVSGDATLASSGALTLTANSVNGTELSSTAVTPGAYTTANITVDADGRITDAASGSLTGLTDVGSATITAGRLLVADGTKFQSVSMSGSCSLAANGAITCTDSGATSLTGLSDVGSAATTAGNILAADGTKFQSVGTALNSTTNTINIQADSLTTGKIANFVSDSADTDTRTLVQITNDNSAAVGATGLTIQQDSNQAGLLVSGSGGGIAVGTYLGPTAAISAAPTLDSADDCTSGNCFGLFSRPTINNPANPDGVSAIAGYVKTANAVFTLTNAIGIYAPNAEKGAASTITNQYGVLIDDQTQGTKNFGLYSAGLTNFNYFGGNVGIGTTGPTQKLHVVGDARISGLASCSTIITDANGNLSCGSAGVSSLTGLSDVGSATITAGRILVADGTKFQSVAVSGDATVSSAGVLNLAANSVAANELSSTAVTAGTYSSAAITVDGDGRIINAASGSLTGLTDVGSATITAGRLLVADGTKFQSVGMSGSCTLASDGAITCAGASSLTGLSDVGSATITAANLLIADGTKFQSVGLSGDATVTSAGVLNLAANSVAANELSSTAVTAGTYSSAAITVDGDGRIINAASGSLTGLTDVGSATITAGRLLVADGTKFQSVGMSGSCTLASDGAITCAGASSLTGLSDVGSATITAANLLIADGTKFQSVGLTGDATVSSAGLLTLATNSVNGTELSSTSVTAGTYSSAAITVDADGRIINAASGSLTGLTDVGSATITAGRLLVADGTKFQSVGMSGSCTLASNGAITCAGASSLTGLSDVGSATITAANLLIADGTKFQSVGLSGDATVSSAGLLTLATNSVNGTELSSTSVNAGTYSSAAITVDADGRIINAASGSLTGLTDVGSATITAGRLLVADGTKFQSVGMSGSCTLASDGTITCAGASSLTGLSDVGSATITAANLLIADGTKFQSVGLTGDATVSSAGLLTLATNSVNGTELSSTAVTAGTYSSAEITVDADGRIINAASGSLTGLTDVGSATITAGRLLIADGTKFQSVGMSGSCSITSAGAITCATGATSLTGLSDVGSATTTVGRLLVADGTKFQSSSTLVVRTDTGNVGIGTTAPSSTFSVVGSIAGKVSFINDTDSPYTVLATDHILIVNTTNGNVIVNLPTAASSSGRIYYIKKTDFPNTITIDGNGAETIDQSATKVITNQNESLTIVSDGTDWWII